MDVTLAQRFDFSRQDQPRWDADIPYRFGEWSSISATSSSFATRRCSGGLVVGSPVELSKLDPVRPMTQMDHVYLSWGQSGGERAMGCPFTPRRSRYR
jgi:hypothetical protein